MEMTLNTIEVRVLGCLAEKEMTTPEYYPLSLNALTNACNQKTNCDPVMTLEETGYILSKYPRTRHLTYSDWLAILLPLGIAAGLIALRLQGI